MRIVTKDGKIYTSKIEEQDVLMRLVNNYNTTHQEKLVIILEPNHKPYLDRAMLKGVMGWLINIGFLFLFFRSMNSMGAKNAAKGVGKNNSKGLFSMEETYGKDNKVRKTVNVKFKDVAGMATPKK